MFERCGGSHLFEYPLRQRGSSYTGGLPGPDRAIFNEKSEFCGTGFTSTFICRVLTLYNI
jgi:hypothetical protein